MTVSSRAPAAIAWRLFAQPGQWHRWAPHVRGARGLGTPEVRAGARGVVRLAGVVPVPAAIVAVEPGRAWTWRVAGVSMRHVVRERADGCQLAIELDAAEPLLTAVALAYGPAIRVLLGNLARVSETEAAAAGARQQTHAR